MIFRFGDCRRLRRLRLPLHQRRHHASRLRYAMRRDKLEDGYFFAASLLAFAAAAAMPRHADAFALRLRADDDVFHAALRCCHV